MAICPAGPPKLMKPSFSQNRDASLKLGCGTAETRGELGIGVPVYLIAPARASLRARASQSFPVVKPIAAITCAGFSFPHASVEAANPSQASFTSRFRRKFVGML